jgi:hypothetical protein
MLGAEIKLQLFFATIFITHHFTPSETLPAPMDRKVCEFCDI